jgi:hypothetical protein
MIDKKNKNWLNGFWVYGFGLLLQIAIANLANQSYLVFIPILLVFNPFAIPIWDRIFKYKYKKFFDQHLAIALVCLLVEFYSWNIAKPFPLRVIGIDAMKGQGVNLLPIIAVLYLAQYALAYYLNKKRWGSVKTVLCLLPISILVYLPAYLMMLIVFLIAMGSPF